MPKSAGGGGRSGRSGGGGRRGGGGSRLVASRVSMYGGSGSTTLSNRQRALSRIDNEIGAARRLFGSNSSHELSLRKQASAIKRGSRAGDSAIQRFGGAQQFVRRPNIGRPWGRA